MNLNSGLTVLGGRVGIVRNCRYIIFARSVVFQVKKVYILKYTISEGSASFRDVLVRFYTLYKELSDINFYKALKFFV